MTIDDCDLCVDKLIDIGKKLWKSIFSWYNIYVMDGKLVVRLLLLLLFL